MLVYQTDDGGFYVGQVTAQPDPLIPGEHLIPRNAYVQAPPTAPEGQVAQWVVDGWSIVDIPTDEEPLPAWEDMTDEEKSARVNDARTGRLVAGVEVTLSTAKTIYLQGRDEDMRNMHGLCTAAQWRIRMGAVEHTTPFRDGNNVIHFLTPYEVEEMWLQGAAWVEQVYSAYWLIKDNLPIPEDYNDDSLWP
tara:strand:+ start:5680 stop:6255 length:576 start_codon:yes stop_codon:yes gene_type:complete